MVRHNESVRSSKEGKKPGDSAARRDARDAYLLLPTLGTSATRASAFVGAAVEHPAGRPDVLLLRERAEGPLAVAGKGRTSQPAIGRG